MKRKFVQIVSFVLISAVLVSVAVYASPVFPGYDPGQEQTVAGNPELASRIMRVGIYYGSAAKQSVELNSVTGSGFQFGYYDSTNGETFVPLQMTECRRLTVSAWMNAITVTDSDTGTLLYQHDGMMGTALGIEPFSMTGEKTVTKCGYPYYGGFRFECQGDYGDQMTIVNMVQLDDYIKGVVPYESSASWPIEALKAQAVCARSYALARIKAAHQRDYHFDLCDGDCCQVYKGVYSGSQVAKVNEAVESTGGVTATYNGVYCELVYSSSNGGASESAINVWGKNIAYLIGKEDPYEAAIADTIPNYHWSKTFTGEELQAKLIAEGYVGCGVITGVKTTLSDTGNVIALTFTDSSGKSYSIYKSSCRTFLSLRSMRYQVSGDDGTAAPSGNGPTVNGGDPLDLSGGVTVIGGDGKLSVISGGYVITADGVKEIGAGGSTSAGTSGKVFTFTGTGWGHNVGLSQYGACSMAQMGYDYRQILEFYYTGVTIG